MIQKHLLFRFGVAFSRTRGRERDERESRATTCTSSMKLVFSFAVAVHAFCVGPNNGGVRRKKFLDDARKEMATVREDRVLIAAPRATVAQVDLTAGDFIGHDTVVDRAGLVWMKSDVASAYGSQLLRLYDRTLQTQSAGDGAKSRGGRCLCPPGAAGRLSTMTSSTWVF